MFGWVTRRVARRAAVIALVSTAVGGVALQLLLPLSGRAQIHWGTWASVTIAGALAAFVITGWVIDRAIGARLRQVLGFLESQARQPDDLQRLPPMGEDEVGRAAQALNRLLASVTTVRVSMIDQKIELAQTQEELRLKDALAAKTGELDARLRERALLFDILRTATTSTALGEVLEALVQRLGPALRLRELAILLHGEGDQFVVRAAHGFDDPASVLGRSVSPGEGIAGEVARGREPVLVRDVSADPQYLAFWGAVERAGSFAAVPIHHGEQQLGILVLTRPPADPLNDYEMRLLTAIADTMALAIRHAQLFEELKDLSTHDELTGLANRRLLQSRISLELERARRFRHPLSVLAVDIDHFKQLNDRHGHATGDRALRAVAQTLEQGVRRVDTVARVGGEEFVVLLPQNDVGSAAHVAEKVRRAVEGRPMPGGEGQPGGRLSISIGVAELRSEEDGDALLQRADEALYFAKERGRNRVVVSPDVTGAEDCLGAAS